MFAVFERFVSFKEWNQVLHLSITNLMCVVSPSSIMCEQRKKRNEAKTVIFDDFEHVSMKEATTIEPHLIQATMKRIQSINTNNPGTIVNSPLPVLLMRFEVLKEKKELLGEKRASQRKKDTENEESEF